MLGITFKENCPDIRNTKAIDVYRALTDFHMNVDLFDPWASNEEVKQEYNIDLVNKLDNKKYDAIVHAVAHKEFSKLNITSLQSTNSVVYDVKGTLNNSFVNKRL